MEQQIVRRSFPVEIEIEERDGMPPMLIGHAAVFNVTSRNLGGYREIIKPGAFQRAINGSQDVVALFNHNENFPLGRSSAGTLTLREDEKGLAVSINPPDTTYARDLMVSMKRGDVRDMSFAFKPVTSKRTGDEIGAIIERHDVDLFDVSPVVFPAYPQTDISVRSMLMDAGIDFDGLSALIQKRSEGLPLEAEDRALVESSISTLSAFIAVEAQEGPVVVEPQPVQARLLSNLRKRIELLAL